MTADPSTSPEPQSDEPGDGGSSAAPAEASTPRATTPRTTSPRKPTTPRKPAAPRKPASPRTASAASADQAKKPASRKPATPRKPAPRKPAASRTTAARNVGGGARSAEVPATDGPSGPIIADPLEPAAVEAIVAPPKPPLPAVGGSDDAAPADEPVVEPEPAPEAAPELEEETVAAEEVVPAAEPEIVEEVVLDVEVVELVTVDVALDEDAALALPVPTTDIVVVDIRDEDAAIPALELRGVGKRFGETRAVEALNLRVPAGTFYGIVGPNGAGKTTTLSMIAGLRRPDSGEVRVNGLDARSHSWDVKKLIGILPDRLRTFDRLTGRQLLYYYGVLRGLDPAIVESRSADLARAFDLVEALARPVADYSAGMTKKVMLAGALIHSPRLLVLDEPFEAVDPVSSAVILEILSAYVANGGTVILSSHGIDLVERVCTRVAVLVDGQLVAEGTIDEVRGDRTLESRFLELTGGTSEVEGLEWLHTFSD